MLSVCDRSLPHIYVSSCSIVVSTAGGRRELGSAKLGCTLEYHGADGCVASGEGNKGALIQLEDTEAFVLGEYCIELVSLRFTCSSYLVHASAVWRRACSKLIPQRFIETKYIVSP